MPADKQTQIFFFVAIFLAILALNIAMFMPFIGAIVIAITLSSMFSSVHKKIFKIFKGKAAVSSLVSVFAVILIVIIPISFLCTIVFKEASVLYSIFRDGGDEAYINNINNIVNSNLHKISSGLSFSARDSFSTAMDFFVNNIAKIFSGISGALFSLFFAMLGLYYIFKDGDKLRKILTHLSPLADEYDDIILNKLSITVNSVIRGSLLVALSQGILTGIGFLIFGIPTPAVWGAVAVICALIPMIGTSLVLIPGILYLFSVGATGAGIGLLAWGILVVGTVDNFMRPKLLEKGIHIHPFFILMSVLGGLEFFGAVGFLLGPLLLSLMFALLDIYKKEFKQEVEEIHRH
jgi:predicted PurR-regulated permease PerM